MFAESLAMARTGGTSEPLSTIIDNLPSDQWDNLVSEFADAAHEQTHAFRGAAWGARSTARVAVWRDGKIVGLALAVTVLARPLRRGIAYIKFGPLWRRKSEEANVETLEYVLKELTSYFVGERRLCLKVLPAADPGYSALMATKLAAFGFRRLSLPDPDRYLVKLQIDQEAQLASLGKTWRYNLKQALKRDLEISIESGRDALQRFDAIFREMERRKSYRSDSWDATYKLLQAGFPAAVQPTLVTVKEGAAMIAGAIVGHIGNTAYYLYGATSDRATEIQAGYAMQWWIIRWLSERGLRWYELGGGAGGPGMQLFKRGLVGKAGVIAQLPGEFSLCRDPISRAVELTIDGARGFKSMLKRTRQSVSSSGGKTNQPIKSSRHLATATKREAVDGRLYSYSEL